MPFEMRELGFSFFMVMTAFVRKGLMGPRQQRGEGGRGSKEVLFLWPRAF